MIQLILRLVFLNQIDDESSPLGDGIQPNEDASVFEMSDFGEISTFLPVTGDLLEEEQALHNVSFSPNGLALGLEKMI
jgi:hypothetical protein